MRLLIAIGSHQAHRGCHSVLRNTWLRGYSGPVEHRFFLGGPSLAPEWDEVLLDVYDDHESLPLKTVAICQWASEHQYTHLFKCDTDTYIDIPRLLASGSDNHDYAGSDLIKCYAISEPGYWLSNRAMSIIANSTPTLSYHTSSGWWNGEDVQVGSRLHEYGIHCHGDRRYSGDDEYPSPDNDYITCISNQVGVIR